MQLLKFSFLKLYTVLISIKISVLINNVDQIEY